MLSLRSVLARGFQREQHTTYLFSIQRMAGRSSIVEGRKLEINMLKQQKPEKLKSSGRVSRPKGGIWIIIGVCS